MNTEIEKYKALVQKLADWSKKYPRGRIYSASNMKMDEELIEMEEEAKKITSQPTQPEGYQGLNKWYKTKRGSKIRVTAEVIGNNPHLECYGIMYDTGLWNPNYGVPKSDIERELTESETKETILKGLEQNGIVKGARVKSLHSYKIDVITNLDINYDRKTNTAWIHCKNWGIKVFDNGTFAEVVKEEKEINCTCINMAASMNCTKNCNKFKELSKFNLMDSSDKELLKECRDYFTKIKSMTLNDVYECGDALLTKLNKHLNHE